MTRRDGILWVAAIGLAWVQLFNLLRVDWTVNAQYGYGWSVPLLAAFLVWQRWTSRPNPEEPILRGMVFWLCAAAILFVVPLRLVAEANPEWRMAFWVHGLIVSGFCLGLTYLAGGWAWVRHFAFVLLFPLIAIPWPMGMERTLIQGLMKAVAAVAVEILQVLSVPALQRGNLIEVASGVVGVDEACSGVRSLQTSLLVTLFLGELYRMSLGRRAAFLGLGALVALLTNVGRTVFLAYAAAREGLGAVDQYHDTAGLLVLGVTLPALWFIGLALRKRSPANPHPAAKPAEIPIVALRALFWLAISSVMIAEAGTEVWYRVHERGVATRSSWEFRWPTDAPAFRELPIGEKSRAILRYEEGKSGSWQGAGGQIWMGFFLRWPPSQNSAQLAREHTPEVCLAGVGQRLKSDVETHWCQVGPLRLPFRQYLFQRGDQTMHVFWCLWENRESAEGQELETEYSLRGRIAAALAGRRDLGQQILELAIIGPETSAEARKVLDQELPRLIHQTAR